MKRIIAPILAVVLVVSALGSAAYATAPNEVHADFHTHYTYHTASNSVPNTFTEQSAWLGTHLHNKGDDTHDPVVSPILDLSADYTVTHVDREEYLVDPPTEPPGIDYRWEFPNIGEHHDQDSGAGLDQTAEFQTGFSVTRSVVPVQVPAGGTQVLTLSITPKEEMVRLEVHGRTDVEGLEGVATVISVSGSPGIEIHGDNRGFYVHIDRPVVNQLYQWQITIQIGSLPEGCLALEYMPEISVQNVVASDNGSAPGGSLSREVFSLDGLTRLGIWTWQASGDYSWGWSESVSKGVHLEGYAFNQVHVNFDTAYRYRTTDNSVTNPTTNEPTHLNSGLHNQHDGTGDPVVGPILELSTTETVTDVWDEEYLVSTDPTYRWEFPPIPECEGFSPGADIAEIVQVSTGLSVSRSVAPVQVSAGDTQTLTLSVTPEVMMDELDIHGRTDVDGFDIATVTSVSGPGIEIHGDGRGFGAGIEEPTVGVTYQWQITIQIGPLPPGLPALEYMPRINVQNVDHIAHGESCGSSLEGTTALGTWTWQATGDYFWRWDKQVTKRIEMEGYAGNHVHVGFETSYRYRTSCNEVTNPTTSEPTMIHTWLHNQHDGTGEDVVNPILDLSTTQTVQWYEQEYLIPGSEYTWEFPNIGQCQSADAHADISEIVEVSTGLSVTRSVELAPDGTRELTLKVTPLETMDALDIHGRADVDGFDIATVTSVSGPGIEIHGDGRSFGAWIEQPTPGDTYEWQIEISIGSLPPEFPALEYMPEINVQNVDRIDNGEFYGSSVSEEVFSLDGVTPLGTWTWNVTGDYLWRWDNRVVKRIEMEGYAAPAYPVLTQETIDQAIDDGLAWLRTQQQQDGSWLWGVPEWEQQSIPETPNVGMTGFALWCFLHHGIPETDPAVSAGIDFILSRQNKNPADKNYGAIFRDQPVYETAIAILALRAANNPVYVDEIKMAADYLARCQNDEDVDYAHFPEGCPPGNWAYGGWSYHYAPEQDHIWVGGERIPSDWFIRADLSCTQFAMIGLKAAEEAGIQLTLPETWEGVWSKAETYVTRSQQPDGGFGYYPAGAPEPGGSSGRMTAAGVWCLRIAGVPVEDSRVQAGLDWLECGPVLDAEPHHYYYYLWTAARAFDICNRSPALQEGNWYSDFAGYLVASQEQNGQWLSVGYPEDRETHLNATEYALLILEKAVLPPPPPPPPPVADAGGPYLVVAGLPLTLDGSASSCAEGRHIVQYYWVFGDGTSIIGSDAQVTHTYDTAGEYTVELTVADNLCAVDTHSTTADVEEPVFFLLIDEDSIDNGNPPNFFSDVDVNDHIADIGLRTQLPFFATYVGDTITLHTGEVGDEGWFALKTIPGSWATAGPEDDGLRNYVSAGPGLGSPDANGDREALLYKILDVTPLRATGLRMLWGKQVFAVVYDSDIGINYDPLNGSLKGDNLGIVAFEVISVRPLTGFSSSSLPQVEIQILDAEEVCVRLLTLFTEAPEPISSSAPPAPVTAADIPELAEHVARGQVWGDLEWNPFEDLLVKPDGTPYKVAYTCSTAEIEITAQAVYMLEDWFPRMGLGPKGGNWTTFAPRFVLEDQIAWFEDMAATMEPDWFMCHSVDADLEVPVVERMVNELGIPVFTLDCGVNTDAVTSFVAHKFEGPGGTDVLAEWLVDDLQRRGYGPENPCVVGEMWGMREMLTAHLRHQGFHSVVVNYPWITVIESRDTNWAEWDTATITADMMLAHPEIKAIWHHGCGGTGMVPGLESVGMLYPIDHPDHIIVASNDCEIAMWDQVIDGWADAFSTHGLAEPSDICLQVAITYVVLGQPVEPFYQCPYIMVTRDNIDTVQIGGVPPYPGWPRDRWDVWLPADPLEPYGFPQPSLELRKQYMGY